MNIHAKAGSNAGLSLSPNRCLSHLKISGGVNKEKDFAERVLRNACKITLNVGYSHPVVLTAPEGVSVKATSATDVEVEGVSKQDVGQFAAEIRAVRPPEPYKGKGIRYVDEYVRRKEGKTGK